MREANTIMRGKCHCTAQWLSKRQDQTSLMIHWCSFLGLGNKLVAWFFTYQYGEYVIFGRMWLCSPLIAKGVRHKIIDAPLTLTSKTYSQSLDAQQLYGSCRQSLLTANTSSLCMIISIQKLWGLPVSDPPQYTLSVLWMTQPDRVSALAAANLRQIDSPTSSVHICHDFLTFPDPAPCPRFRQRAISDYQNLDYVPQVWSESYAVECMDWCCMTVLIHPVSRCALSAPSMSPMRSLT